MSAGFLSLLLIAQPVAAHGPESYTADFASEAPPEIEIDIATDTPVSHDDLLVKEIDFTASRLWRAPVFKEQKALGWNESAFQIPKGMETQVKFWIDIYSKYTTDQGVLHDAENIDLIYQKIDFTDISGDTSLTGVQKERKKINRVKDAKKAIIAMLKKFETIKDPSELSKDERRVWEYLVKVDEPKKFTAAAQKNRLRFQLGQKDRMIQGIFLSGRYLEDFERIFEEAGLPKELTRLVFVESSFNVLARSKVGASGLWQIMGYTMKPYMKRDPSIDLRNHPIEATKLAAKLLKQNYSMLEAWPLAVTGYNHGPTGVLKLTKKYKTRELGELVKNVQSSRSFGFASRNFYASFLAALEVERKASEYLGAVNWSQRLESTDVKLKKPLQYQQLLKWFDGDDFKAQVYNPHINHVARKQGRPIPAGVVVSIPKKLEKQVLLELSEPETKQADTTQTDSVL